MAEFEVRMDAAKVLAMLSRIGDKNSWRKILKSLVSVFGFKDVIDHFGKEQGEDGKWPALSPAYRKWKSRKYPGRQKLVLSSRLRQSFLPANTRYEGNDGVAFFNPVEYADKHDLGKDGVPQRQFMWLSGRAMNQLERGLLDQMTRGS